MRTGGMGIEEGFRTHIRQCCRLVFRSGPPAQPGMEEDLLMWR